jgi:hypothetical protein
MNINQLRTPEGLNHYLNVVTNQLTVKVPDSMMKLFLWQKVKFDFLSHDEVNIDNVDIYEDNTFLRIKMEESNEVLNICYFHLSENFCKSKELLKSTYHDINTYIKIVVGKLKEMNSSTNNITLITTYKLSYNKEVKLHEFPNYIKYLYIVESPELKIKHYEIVHDEFTNEFMEGDILFKGLMDEAKKQIDLE